VNWFRRDEQGKFLWPGYGDNLRVLAWMLERVAGTAGANDTAIGALPRAQDLNVTGLDITPAALEELLKVDHALWRKEVGDIRKYLTQYGTRLPQALTQNLDQVEKALS
jgi:phosphoenolpyruvate carboxykinase (GTP)